MLNLSSPTQIQKTSPLLFYLQCLCCIHSIIYLLVFKLQFSWLLPRIYNIYLTDVECTQCSSIFGHPTQAHHLFIYFYSLIYLRPYPPHAKQFLIINNNTKLNIYGSITKVKRLRKQRPTNHNINGQHLVFFTVYRHFMVQWHHIYVFCVAFCVYFSIINSKSY